LSFHQEKKIKLGDTVTSFVNSMTSWCILFICCSL